MSAEASGAAGDDAKRSFASPSDQSLELMDGLLSKLTILNYEYELCAKHDLQPFAPGYFAVQAQNVPVQFYHFITVAAYLAQAAGRDFEVDALDNPTTSANKLMRELSAAGFEADFPPTRLRYPHGEPACRALNFLSDLALRARGFNWYKPVYPSDDPLEEGLGGEGEEGVGDEDEDEIEEAAGANGMPGGGGSGGGGEEALFTEGGVTSADGSSGGGSGTGTGGGAVGMVGEDDLGLAESGVDALEWRAEVERLSRHLRAEGSKGGAGEWRAQLSTTGANTTKLDAEIGDTSRALEKIEADLAGLTERVGSREKFINSAFSYLSEEFRGAYASVDDSVSLREQLQKELSDASNTQASVSDALEEARARMEERGTSMTDTTPLVRIKKALAALRHEMRGIDVRIGVASHTIMQSHMMRQRQAAGGGQGGEQGGGADGGRRKGKGGGDGEEDDEDDAGFELSGDDDFLDGSASNLGSPVGGGRGRGGR